MQKIVFLFFLLIARTESFSQQEYFLYIQADDRQPFYATINNKMYSSSEGGYMIISKLGDTSFILNIGFAKNTFPEQHFLVNLNKKDLGFQLKNFGEKGWGLVNLQSMAVIMNSNSPKTSTHFTGIRKTDSFSELLANVVNDSAILYAVVKAKAVEPIPAKNTAVNKKEEQQTEESSSLSSKEHDKDKNAKADSSLLTRTQPAIRDTATREIVNEPVKTPKKELQKEPVINEHSTAKKDNMERPFITRLEEDNSEGMYSATYIEQYIFTTDTIRIFIPQNARLLVNSGASKEQVDTTVIQKIAVEEKKQNPEPQNPGAIKEQADTAVMQKKVIEEKKPNSEPIDLGARKEQVDTAVMQKRAVEEKKQSSELVNKPAIPENPIQLVNSDCKNLATDYDVDKLRIKLIDQKIMDDKLATARKYFKSKCFTVKQIKALTELFITDETKYYFLDASYPFVSDSTNFHMLEEVIKNDYYKNRFRAMIHK